MDTETDEWDSFDELVTWATWCILEGITKGLSLRSIVFEVVSVTRLAKFKGDK